MIRRASDGRNRMQGRAYCGGGVPDRRSNRRTQTTSPHGVGDKV
jgi:hypothetical protein